MTISKVYCFHSRYTPYLSEEKKDKITLLKYSDEPLQKRLFLILDEIESKLNKHLVPYEAFDFTELRDISFDNWIILNAYKYTGEMWESIRNDYFSSKPFAIAYLSKTDNIIKYTECKYNYKLKKFTEHSHKFEVLNAN